MSKSKEELAKQVVELVVGSPEFANAMNLLKEMGQALLKGPFETPVADELVLTIDRGSVEVEVRSKGHIVFVKDFP